MRALEIADAIDTIIYYYYLFALNGFLTHPPPTFAKNFLYKKLFEIKLKFENENSDEWWEPK